MTQADDPTPAAALLATLRSLARRNRVTLGDVVDTFGATAFVPALAVPALVVVSPLSGIPLLPTVCGLAIALIALQMLMGRRTLWLPAALRARSLTGGRLSQGLDRLAPVLGWIDRHARPRWPGLWRFPLAVLPQAACVLCGLAMPFLEIVPFSSTILGLAVTSFALGFLIGDGLLAMAGAAFMAIGAALPLAVVASIAD